MLQILELLSLFNEINRSHFDGFLDPPVLRWNSRLRSSAGRFMPGSRRFFQEAPPAIEIASYLLEEGDPRALVADTLGHEMIHYWLWVRRHPYGHTPEFWEKMELMGVSRYNTVPRARPYRYLYHCPVCATEFPARKRLGVLACARCCKQHANGRFDARFKLFLKRSLSASEGLELFAQKS
jgi:predicted SprT family Zn-dependent metalloprotease